MSGLSTTELAEEFGVSKGRVSQWVKEGKLRGCFYGDGRNRRFDLNACAIALGRNLDTAQALGNGRKTLNAIGSIEDPVPHIDDEDDAESISDSVKARYDLARTMRIEEQARAARYQNGLLDGSLVLASEVERNVMAQLGQEIAAFENVIRRCSQAVADEYGLKGSEVRKVMLDVWRSHRKDRSDKANARASKATATQTEKDADF